VISPYEKFVASQGSRTTPLPGTVRQRKGTGGSGTHQPKKPLRGAPNDKSDGKVNAQIADRILIIRWLSVRGAAAKIDASTDTIERRAIPWQDTPVAYSIRYKYLVLDEGGERTRRYFEPDLEALIHAPDSLPVGSRPRIIPRYVPSKRNGDPKRCRGAALEGSGSNKISNRDFSQTNTEHPTAKTK
jgi:hypothetical protein